MINGAPMLNTPATIATSSAAPAAPGAPVPDATPAFAALLASNAIGGTETPTTAAAADLVAQTLTGAAPDAAAAEGESQALPHVLEQLAMAASPSVATPVPAVVADDAIAQAALVVEPETDAPRIEAGKESESDTDEAVDATLALVDVSALLPTVAPPVIANVAPAALGSGTAPATGAMAPKAAPQVAASTTQATPANSAASEPQVEVAESGATPPTSAEGDAGSDVRHAASSDTAAFSRSLEQNLAQSGDGTPTNGAAAVHNAAAVAEVRTSPATSRPPVLPQIEMPAEPSAGFDDTLGARMSVAIDQGISHARIRVSPEHLGAIDLFVAVDGDKVTAQFHSQHADVRTAIEGSLSRLRDHLADQGLQLTGANVSSQSSGSGNGAADQQARQAQSFGGSENTNGSSDGTTVIETAAPAVRHVGLVDEYA